MRDRRLDEISRVTALEGEQQKYIRHFHIVAPNTNRMCQYQSQSIFVKIGTGSVDNRETLVLYFPSMSTVPIG